MAVFSPPTDALVMWALPGERGIFSYLAPAPRGKNVFKMLDGSFTEIEPHDYWNIDKIYHGGHSHVLTAAEEADLVAAGYGDYIT